MVTALLRLLERLIVKKQEHDEGIRTFRNLLHRVSYLSRCHDASDVGAERGVSRQSCLREAWQKPGIAAAEPADCIVRRWDRSWVAR